MGDQELMMMVIILYVHICVKDQMDVILRLNVSFLTCGGW